MLEKQEVLTETKEISSGGGTPMQAREHLYQTQEIVPWGDGLLTVNDANALFQAYFAENSPKADELTALIKTAKEQIRTENPDEEAQNGTSSS
jgi:hypothetical protein